MSTDVLASRAPFLLMLAGGLLAACAGANTTTQPSTVCLAWPQACRNGKPLISGTPLSKARSSDGRTCYTMAYTEDWPSSTGEHIRLCGTPGAAVPAVTCYAGSRRLGPDASGSWPQACDIANVALSDGKPVWVALTAPTGAGG